MGPGWSNRARLPDDVLQALMELPGTRGMGELRVRAEDLTAWKLALQKGTLPKLEEVSWPQEPFKTKFADALRNLEMPRFTRRYPAILNTLIKQMLTLVQDFEAKMAEAEEKQQKQQQQQQQRSMPQSQQQSQQQDGDNGQSGQAGGGGGDSEESEGTSQQEMQDQLEEALEGASEAQAEKREMKVQLQDADGDAGEPDKTEVDPALAKALDKIAEDIVNNFEQQMASVMENLERGEAAFDDLNALLDSGSEGFDLSRGTWRRSGWRELDTLRKVLEACPELRDLVRQLGRGGGKGPLRRAPEELEARGYPPGVIRSPLQPEEVRGLTRSGELSRMLPSEMALLAHGWPRRARADSSSDEGDAGRPAQAGGSGSPPAFAGAGASGDEDGLDMMEYYLPGAHAARMLHRVRRAERMLLSYERTGWLEDEPARVTSRMEIRPAAELGPIILCLDTSGSMKGARETVAKALALECLRGAHRQRRPCYLYAFSGPSEVQELELKVDVDALDALLEFLSSSFMGGTDVDAPLKLSLERLGQQQWAQADILMVTDGEIPQPDDTILATIRQQHELMGLEVHGLLVSSNTSDQMKALCTHLHTFRSWTAVGGNDYMY